MIHSLPAHLSVIPVISSLNFGANISLHTFSFDNIDYVDKENCI